MENTKIIDNINKIKSWFFENINKNGKLVARKNKRRFQLLKSVMEKGALLLTLQK